MHPMRMLAMLLAAAGVAAAPGAAAPGATAPGATAPGAAPVPPPRSILFIGNSFTYGQGSPVRVFRAETVTDLNGQGIGGVPALFGVFAREFSLSYDVALETHPGVGLDWHLANARPAIERRPWDVVVLQGFSTLDADKPGDPGKLVTSVHALSPLLLAKNPAVEIRLDATWPRPDQVFLRTGGWFGKSIEAMANDVRTGYELAAAGTPGVRSVVKVGDAWVRAVHEGVADGNPYDGIDAGKIDLWAEDHYHASTYGYYLEALMLFGGVTGRDPRALGEHECAAAELGLAPTTVQALQRVAAEQLIADGALASEKPAAPLAIPAHGPCPPSPSTPPSRPGGQR